MTAESTGEPVLWWLDIYLRDESQHAEEFRIFYRENRLQLTAVYCHRRGCKGNVSCTSYSRTKDYVKLHIMATTTSTLSQTR